MLLPHFVYPIAGTPWYIAISKGGKHFYYNSCTKASVWQIGETDIDNLDSRVNFDDLAVLFAKSNGIDFHEKKGNAEKGNASKRQNSLESGSYESDEEPSETRAPEQEPELEKDPDAETVAENHPEEEITPPEKKASAGLALGYSSSEEEPSESESDVNSGLDLGLDDENEDDTNRQDHIEAFEAILDEYKDEISIMDPWMLVEEDLLPKFSQHAAFYNVPKASMREEIFNNWVVKRDAFQKEEKRETYPTVELRYYRFLQTHKNDVRKMYFVDFERKHKAQLEDFHSCDLDTLYRQLRVTLNDFAAFERAQKKNTRANDTNLKVAHVEKFLAKELGGYTGPSIELKHDLDPFDQWMQICNLLSLPLRLVHDPRNFILGDEKRLLAYKKCLGLS